MENNKESDEVTLGLSPAVLAHRDYVKPRYWCPPKPDVEFDPKCDPKNPKTISYTSVTKAAHVIKKFIPDTPLIKSRCLHRWKRSNINLYYKIENVHHTGSFLERVAIYCLFKLNDDQRKMGVITASLGNWGMALAYHAQKLCIPVTVVLPKSTLQHVIQKCQSYGASTIVHGENFAEAKRQACVVQNNSHTIYINGYDHPLAIAASGTIGLEILKKLPETDVIVVPIGGGGLITGIAVAVKKIKPDILVYGVEPKKCNSFSQAMEKGKPTNTEVQKSIATSLVVSTVGCNAFHTAKSLIDKIVLVEDGYIAKAMLHLFDTEKLVVEGAGACSLSALMVTPNILPELQDKTVVCVLSGGNVDVVTFPICLKRAKILEGQIVKLKVKLDNNNILQRIKLLKVIANMGCNVIKAYSDNVWIDLNKTYLTLICETTDIKQACTLRRVMNIIFPDICEIDEEPFKPTPCCACFPNRV